jgi:hypothetical protein
MHRSKNSAPLAALAALAVVAAAAVLTGCVSLYPVQLRDGAIPRGQVNVGDRVRVETRGGESLTFEVTGVENGVVTGDKGERVAAADMQTLEVERLNKKTTIITLSVIGGIIVTAIAVDAVDDCIDNFECEY